VYKFEIVEGASNAPPVTTLFEWTDTHETRQHYGDAHSFATALNRELVAPIVERAVVPVTSAYFVYGQYFVTTTGSRIIVIPRGLIGDLALLAAGQPRTPALYQMLLTRAKSHYRALNYPADLAAQAAVYAAIAGMVRDVEHETINLGTATRIYSRLYGQHARVLDFEPIHILTARHAAAATSLATGTAIPLHYYGLDAVAFKTAAAGLSLAVLHPFISVAAVVPAVYSVYRYATSVRSHRTAEARQWAALREEGFALAPGKVLHFDKPPAFTSKYRPKTPSPVTAPGTRVRVLPTLLPKYDKAEQRAGLRLVGLGFSSITPNYLHKTVETAVAGLRTRVMRLNEYPPSRERWRALTGRLESPQSVLRFLVVRNLDYQPERDFENWVVRFPQALQRTLREAKAENDRSGFPLPRAARAHSGIVKLEKIGAVTDSGYDPEDPRIVISLHPRMNAVVGPISHHRNTILQARFTSTTARPRFLAWAVRMSAEEVGFWFDYMVNHFSGRGRVTFLYFDQSKFETRQGREVQAFHARKDELSGFPAEVRAEQAAIHTLHGNVQGLPVSFKRNDPVQTSGQPNTSSENFASNAAAVVDVVGEPGPDTFAAIINGDDGILISYDNYMPSFDAFNAGMHRLGFHATGARTYEVADVEFCSMIPYPAEDGTVFAPKIGRILQRFGWTANPNESDVYGAAVSLRDSVAHVPFLRDFVDLHVRLATPTNTGKAPFMRYAMAFRPHNSTPATYEFIEKRYGLTTQHEDAFIRSLSTVQKLPALLEFQLLEAVFRRDA